MPLIKSVRGYTPTWGEDCFIADNATIVGQVTMGSRCSVWFNAVVRGDVSAITIGDNTNIQDGAVIHATYQRNETIIGNNVSIAHNAIVHGCTIEDNVLIGMGAIIMDGVVVKKGSIIGAGAIVLQNTIVEEGSIWAGNPAKFIKQTQNLESEILRIASAYPMYAQWFKEDRE
ncbi:gamma carbonic anhydrase family protein [Eisenibacter elegans]|jgi:carbonic anhydrase/acetyltransferase-like protein (isoleucine patch superfamily)|uniref:gamma carbonic anhydrase family protein n=1 Tax=Eisenibacter elegans TaxID=997 RepID=UPI0004272A30|nr:gamma carbonic anhydrase family protein [Eisenibacter elegans]